VLFASDTTDLKTTWKNNLTHYPQSFREQNKQLTLSKVNHKVKN